ncbi:MULTISPECIES: hypothetical protein [unclassified Methylobacterium]|uniref:hypothetical protein n=1 Tax=unclassified Methylobacterium TaxID=2615210 RepID=UPI0011C1E372|nr:MULTISPECIES: hypothetical protein [unclassified Methylobacterium]QEE40664.1 hypothetical protein FVA80_18380 [Methylobacterium sp. WL1]TXN58012.1 hypothetical protein FV241_08530 [Methylobacterium sp. WL2]
MAGQHGGRRPGAGRKSGPVIGPDSIIALVDVLSRLPCGEAGRRRRCATALAAYGASNEEIAAALAIESADLAELVGADIDIGRIVLRANIRHEIMRAGLGQGRTFSVAAAKTALRWLAPPEARR